MRGNADIQSFRGIDLRSARVCAAVGFGAARPHSLCGNPLHFLREFVSHIRAIIKPMRLVPVLFIVTILISGLLGAAVAGFYSEPMNRFLRNYSRSRHAKPASAMDSESVVPSET
jgi:hypothetical protein